MRHILYITVAIVLIAVWPQSRTVAKPARFQNPDQSIAMDDEKTSTTPTEVARIAPPESDGPSMKVSAKDKEQTQDEATDSELVKTRSVNTKLADKDPTNQQRNMTISEALSRDEAGIKETDEDAGQEVIEWVGKDRRIKRIKKVPGTIYLKSQKIPGKLIITDDYHQSHTELLGTAGIRHYGARPEESKWYYSGSKFLCELRHPIPGFGHAVMKQGIEDQLKFQLEVDGIVGGTGRARIQSKPPIWKRFTRVRDLGVADVIPEENVLFAVDGMWVKRLMLEMREGMQPTISFWDDDTGGEDVVVTVSSFNSQKHLSDFAQCLGNLLPYSFKDVRKRTVYFGYDKFKLSADQRARLKKLIEYVKLDEEVKKINITGFSDSVGFARYNKTLAKRRADEVKKYLLAQGLPSSKLEVNAKGEKGKKFSNRTEKGRQKNRRVEVTLIK